jgi:hypothetical protein
MTFECTRTALTTLSFATTLAVCIAACTAENSAPGNADEPIGSVESALQSSCGLLKSGEALMNTYAPAIEAKACGGSLALDMQTDGNLVLYRKLLLGTVRENRPVWATGTNGRGVAVILQTDGNLTLVDDHWDVIWQTNTGGHPGAELHLQDDGNMFLWWNNQNIWSAGTWDGIDGTKAQPEAPSCDNSELNHCYELAKTLDVFGAKDNIICLLNPPCIPVVIAFQHDCEGPGVGGRKECELVTYAKHCRGEVPHTALEACNAHGGGN